mmetsp:Transcript_4961/g.7314  ORF Transcript_4961/g.7314 Transcript_4961/m.7314 type:complete len:538 (+) Transcript_4961:1238-2851(+)
MYRHQEEAGEEMRRSRNCSSSLQIQKENDGNNNEEKIKKATSGLLEDDNHRRNASYYNRRLMERVFEAIENFFNVNHFDSPLEAIVFLLRAIFSELSLKEPNLAAVEEITKRYPEALLYLGGRRTGAHISSVVVNTSSSLETYSYQGDTQSASANDNAPREDDSEISMLVMEQRESGRREDNFRHTPLNLVCNHSSNPFFIVSMLQAAYKHESNEEEEGCLLSSLIIGHERDTFPASTLVETLIYRKDEICSQVLRILKKIRLKTVLVTTRSAGNDDQEEAEEKIIDIGNKFEKAATKGHTATLIALLEMNPSAIFQKNSETFYMPLQNTVLDFRYGETDPDALHYLPQEEWASRVAFLLNEGIKYGINLHQNSTLSPPSRSESLYLLGGLFAVDSEIDGFLSEMIHLFGHSRVWDLLKSCLGQYSYQEAPILHAAIGKVHQDTLNGIINNFRYSAFLRDHEGNLALHVGIKKRLKWTHGLCDIVKSNPRAVKEIEVSTGLPAFAFAAVQQMDSEGLQIEKTDMKTLYELCLLGLHP